MKRSLLQKAKSRIVRMMRPIHKHSTRARKMLVEPNTSAVCGVQLIRNSGLGIEYSRACRGRNRAFPRISRSKYSPAA